MATTDQPGGRGATRRAHAVLPHTADAGLSATGPDLPALFEEAALALAELAAEVEPGAGATQEERLELTATDVDGLAYAWLNELVALVDAYHAAIVTVSVDEFIEPARPDEEWRLRGRVGMRAHGAGAVRALAQPKSATYHGLAVAPDGERWTLRAYIDL